MPPHVPMKKNKCPPHVQLQAWLLLIGLALCVPSLYIHLTECFVHSCICLRQSSLASTPGGSFFAVENRFQASSFSWWWSPRFRPNAFPSALLICASNAPDLNKPVPMSDGEERCCTFKGGKVGDGARCVCFNAAPAARAKRPGKEWRARALRPCPASKRRCGSRRTSVSSSITMQWSNPPESSTCNRSSLSMKR